jgi:hypothetical protein
MVNRDNRITGRTREITLGILEYTSGFPWIVIRPNTDMDLHYVVGILQCQARSYF